MSRILICLSLCLSFDLSILKFTVCYGILEVSLVVLENESEFGNLLSE